MSLSKNALRGLMLIAAFWLAACTGGGAGRATRASGQMTTGGGSTVGQSGFAEKCSDGTTAYGYVYERNVSTVSFKQMVEGLVSASLSPESLGDISGEIGASTGVDLRFHLKVNSNGQLDLAQSRIQLLIYDSMVGQVGTDGQQIQAYEITISQAAQQQQMVDMSARKFQVTFADEYGSITLDGGWSGNTATGQISFANSRHVSGGQPASGLLGAFSVPTCGIF